MSNNPAPRHGSPIRPNTAVNTAVNTSDGPPESFVTPPYSGKRLVFPYLTECDAKSRPGARSPPLSPLRSPGARRTRPEPAGKGLRLRGKGGLKIQVNEPALRQYTDYDTLGTPRSALFSPSSWAGNTPGEPDVQTSLERLKNDTVPTLPIFDLFAAKTVRAVLKDLASVERLRQFADTRGRSSDVDFVLQVGGFDECVSLLACNVDRISSRLTGLAATSPIRLPPTLGRDLNREVRDASNTLLPRLRRVFEEANSYIEQSLAQDVYPDFLKFQVCKSLQAVRPGYIARCHRFAESFCITDPKRHDNPMIFVSPGLARLTGYAVTDLIHRNCGMFQGPVKRGSCVDWMRDEHSQHETTELVLNYTSRGLPFWNLVFVARLVGPDGALKYHLGGQIDVTKMLEREEDLINVLQYASSRSEGPPATGKSDDQDAQASWTGRPSGGRPEREREPQPKYPPSASRNSFIKSFRRRFSSSSSPGSESSDEMSSGSPSTPTGRRGFTLFPNSDGSSTTFATQLCSPFSRFLVLQYVKPTRVDARRGERRCEVELPVVFCSTSTLHYFGGGRYTCAEILGLDVFEVLADKAGASVTKSSKSEVQGNLAKCRTTKLNMTLGAGRHKRSRGLSLSRKSSFMSSSGAGESLEHAPSSRSSFSRDRLIPGINSSEAAEDFATYWTPLVDGRGLPCWVVVVLVPEVE